MMNSSLWIHSEIFPPHFQCAALTLPPLLCLEMCGICFALSQKNTGKFSSHFSSSVSPGLSGNVLFHFLPFVQLRPYLPALNNNTSPYLQLVQCVTPSRTQQTAAFPKTWIVFLKIQAGQLFGVSQAGMLPLDGLGCVPLSVWHGASSEVGPIFIQGPKATRIWSDSLNNWKCHFFCSKSLCSDSSAFLARLLAQVGISLPLAFRLCFRKWQRDIDAEPERY